MPDPQISQVVADQENTMTQDLSSQFSDRSTCAACEDEVDRLRVLLWECHCAASDGIPVPFERWLADGGPEGMPADVRELRDAYDTVSEHEHTLEGRVERVREAVSEIWDDLREIDMESAAGWGAVAHARQVAEVVCESRGGTDENCNDGETHGS